MSKVSVKLRRWQGVPDASGARPSIYLGSLCQGDYDTIAGHLRELQRCKRLAIQMTAGTAAWLSSIGDELHEKIAGEGLCHSRVKCSPGDVTIAAYVAAYIERRSDVGKYARANLRQTEQKLVEFFGKDRTMNSVTVGDAKAFRQWLEGEGFAVATIAMHIKKARQFFGDAVDREILVKTPFSRAVKAGTQVNAAKMRYVSAATVELVMAKAADLQWRLVLALARYAGLRCPSEVGRLTWGDVDFGKNQIRVRSDKTLKQGKGERVVPIHPRLSALLGEAFTAAPDRQERVIARVESSTNLRTQIARMCTAAEVEAWPKPLQNLRLSCETDWMDSDGVALACKWSGNTPDVALKHYHLVRDEDYIRVKNRGAESGAERCRSEVKGSEGVKTATAASVGNSSTCTPMHSDALAAAAAIVPPRGSENLPDSAGNSQILSGTSAESSADPELIEVVRAWPLLSFAGRETVLLIVRHETWMAEVESRAEVSSGGDPTRQGGPRSGRGTPRRCGTPQRGEGSGKGPGPCRVIPGVVAADGRSGGSTETKGGE